MLLFEVKMNCYDRLCYIVNNLGFDEVYLVPSIGIVGGLAFCWKKSLDIQIIYSFGNFILRWLLTTRLIFCGN